MSRPWSVRPNRQLMRWRQESILPAGWVLALMMLEAAPTPCNRTGFHITSSSVCVALVLLFTPAVEHATPGVAAVEQVGSMMIRSPGAAASIALWIEPEARTWAAGGLPPI